MFMVKAVHWNEKKQKQEWYVAGVFDNFANASIFKEAYKTHYSCDQVIISDGHFPAVPVI